ncbi:hypothetical protein GF407_03430 [candidate division KSB1 bacterium]|nr:hypothetical protein [candidate division KSB1 bacterium]
MYTHVLTQLGRFDDAIVEREKSIALDPLSPQFQCNGCYTYLAAGQYEKAIEQSRKTTEQFGGACSFEDLVIGWAYNEKGMHDQALKILKKRNELSKNRFRIIGEIGRTYAFLGKIDSAKQTLNELNELAMRRQGHPSYYLSAAIYAALGNKNEAFTMLEKAYDTRDWQFPWLKVDHRLNPLRSDTQFDKIAQKLKF